MGESGERRVNFFGLIGIGKRKGTRGSLRNRIWTILMNSLGQSTPDPVTRILSKLAKEIGFKFAAIINFSETFLRLP